MNVAGARTERPLSHDELTTTDAYWRPANYLSAGQIYLRTHPRLREPLTHEHVKSRLRRRSTKVFQTKAAR